ncbi:MAG: DUF2100 domain-containing protein [Candidatus Heimdallarchaeota archaeon]
MKALITAIDNLIEIKVLIREITPNYDLDNKLNKKYLFLLKRLNSTLQPIFDKYLQESSEIKNSLNDILDLIKRDYLLIVSANYIKRKLKNLGVDPRNLIVTGGPLFIENYKKVNPTISNKTLFHIKEKCELLVEKLSKSGKELAFLYNKDNLTDQIILKELEVLENIINKKIITKQIIDDQIES